MRIDESVFLISGGASGLGLATARELVGQGGKAVLLDINAEAGQQALAELGANAHFVRADITREEDGSAAVAQVLEAFGALHGWSIAPAWRQPRRCWVATVLMAWTVSAALSR